MSDTEDIERPPVATYGAIAAALSKAQAEMKPASRDSTNPYFKTSYANLASVWEACREPLTKHGLSVVQLVRTTGNDAVVETLLLHTSGEFIRGELSVPASKRDAQGIGSAITYARRYALSAMVGIAPDDDDGNNAVGHGASPAKPASRSSSKPTAPPTSNPSGSDEADFLTD